MELEMWTPFTSSSISIIFIGGQFLDHFSIFLEPMVTIIEP